MAASNSFPVLRGLEVRIQWGIALGLFDEETRADALASELNCATDMGIGDYQEGIHAVPTLFKDVPALVRAWWHGQDLEAESDDMACCPGCQNPSGNPCPSHG